MELQRSGKYTRRWMFMGNGLQKSSAGRISTQGNAHFSWLRVRMSVLMRNIFGNAFPFR